MLIYSKDYLLPLGGNIITLFGENSDYYYVHRSLYDLAVILNEKYSIEELTENLGFTSFTTIMEEFSNTVPEPLQILSSYLGFVKIEEETITNYCGAIHCLNKLVDLRSLLNVLPEIRKTVKFTLNPNNDFLLQWSIIKQEWLEYNKFVTEMLAPSIHTTEMLPSSIHTTEMLPSSIHTAEMLLPSIHSTEEIEISEEDTQFLLNILNPKEEDPKITENLQINEKPQVKDVTKTGLKIIQEMISKGEY